MAPQSFEELIDALAERGIRPGQFAVVSPHISHPFLLKGIAKGWWDITSACFNPNLQWECIEKSLPHLHDKIIRPILLHNRTISWPQLKTLIEIPGSIPQFASGNPIMPFSYILEYPEIDWITIHVLRREDYTHENSVLFSKIKGEPLVPPGELTYDMMKRNRSRDNIYINAMLYLPHHPIDRILKDLAGSGAYSPWGVYWVCKHPDFTPEMMKVYPKINWSWYPLQSKSMTKEDMLALFKPPLTDSVDAKRAFWSHPSITLDMIGTVEPFCIDGLISNPNLTWDFIIENPEMFRDKDLSRVDWSVSEGIVTRRREAATAIQRWYRRVTIFDLTYPRAEKKFRLSMEEMYP